MVFLRLVLLVLTCEQIQLVNPKDEWKYRNAWFVYQYDMPMFIRRR
jgi:hypothetical protein